jgi:hypothetical protein
VTTVPLRKATRIRALTTRFLPPSFFCKLESIGSASLLAYLPDRAVTHYGRAELEDDDTGQQHVSDLFERIIIDRKTRFGETTDR